MDDSDFLPGEEPNYMRGAAKGSTSVYYINGDYHFPGKPILFNSKYIRNFDNFLDHLTNNLKPRFGAVRTVYTPDHGHRVRTMNDISPNKSYVVSGADRFHRFPYASIDQIRKRRNKRTHITYDVPPVVHARHQVSGRIKRCNTTGKVIKCWANGEDVNEPHTIHIPPSLVNEQSWDRIFDLMTISVRDLTGPPVKVYTRQGQEVSSPQELDHMGYYVIAPKFNRLFKDVEYKEVRRANFHTSPLPERRVLPPVRSKNNSKSNSLQSSPDHSWASHPGSENGYSQKHRRNLARQRQEEAQNQGFYAKPTAHKRSGEAKGKPVDLDQDKGGVFKAKSQNRATRGAQEVKESGDTRTEVPIDQRKAEVVSDEDEADWEARDAARASGSQEDIKTNKKGKDTAAMNGPRNGRATRGQQQNEQPPPTKAKTNSYRGPPPPSDNSHPPATNGIKQNSPPATSTPKGKEAAKKTKSPSPPPPAARQDMSEDEAATKIQAQFRGHQTRREMERNSPQRKQQQQEEERRGSPKTTQEYQRAPSPQLTNEEMSEEQAATKIQANFRGFKARKEVEEKKATAGSATPQGQEQGRSPSPTQKTEAGKEAEAATKIQAVYRGHATRQELAARQRQEQDLKPGGPAASPEPVPGFSDDRSAREEAAATKIQATYRGHATRRQLQQQQQQQGN